MLTIRHLILSGFLIASLVSCQQKKNAELSEFQTGTDSLRQIIKVIRDSTESFDEFLESFSTSKEFQIERVVFPFFDCDYPGDNNSHCDTIQKSNWIYLTLVDTSKSPIMITKTYDNFKLEMLGR